MSFAFRSFATAGVFTVFGAAAAAGQAPAKPAHPPVCAKGVRVFTERSQIPVPFDTLTIPRSPTPIRITSPEEADAAVLALRERAGALGATGILMIDVVEADDGGMERRRRTVTGIRVPADVAKAQEACK